ncbi:MAG: glycosyltransferase, partial [Thermosynechococcaceae cyanobacterium]
MSALPHIKLEQRHHLVLLLVITALGIGLRLLNLTGKPPWTDEFATLVFGLGHSFETIPLDQVITQEVLLQPLVPTPGIHLDKVLEHLFGESNHPPLYFLLTHLWLQMFPTSEGLVSLWGARSLSALFGAASIPAIFGLGYLAFRSLWIAQLSAVLMATSPLGIYLAQEARHYTLPILFAIASLACLLTATRALAERRRFPLSIVLIWVAVNGLGVATHYFFSLTIGAEGIVLAAIAGHQLYAHRQSLRPNPFTALPAEQNRPEQKRYIPFASLQSIWVRIGAVALGTLTSMVVWLPFLEGVQDSEITQWIHKGDRAGLEWLDPVFQMLAGMITMLYMLPIQADLNWIRVVSYASLVILAIWTGFKLTQGFRLMGIQHSSQILGGFVGGAIALFLIITYGFEREV